MKISIVDAEAIRKNILNTSQSKQGYSFSKTNRFNKPFSKYYILNLVAQELIINPQIKLQKERLVLDMEIDLILLKH